MPDLARQLFVPVDIVAPRFLLRDRFGIVRDAEKTEACDDGIELVILPMPGEIVELGKEIVEGIVCRIELFDVSSRVQLLDIFRIREDDVESSRSDERRGGKECVSTCKSRWTA